MHQVSIDVTSGEGFGGWFEIGVQLLCEGRRHILWDTRPGGCQGDTRTGEGEQTMGRAATSVASMVTLPGRLFDCQKLQCMLST